MWVGEVREGKEGGRTTNFTEVNRTHMCLECEVHKEQK